MANKKYYWLRLKEDFFKNLRMKKLRTIAGGNTYTIIYLKMQLLSLQNEGMLYYEGVEDTFEKEIALLIDENIKDVKITIGFLLSNDLLIEKESGVYELTETKDCIGSETNKAEPMRKLREKQRIEKLEKGNNVTTMLPDVTFCYTEKEIEKEKKIEKETDTEKNQKIIKCYEENIGSITPASAELILSYLDDFSVEMIIEAIKTASIQNVRKSKYIAGILNDWQRKGYKNLLDIQDEKNKQKDIKIDTNCTHNFENELSQYDNLYDN